MSRATAIIAAVFMVWATGRAIDHEAAAHSLACPPPPTARQLASLPTEYPRFYRQLRISFGRSWKDAAVVAWKEGSWHWWARNGQYLGTFQMGSFARGEYGHANHLPGQVIAAAKYWRDAGWSPWECQP
jgi:hypothetical protein